MLPEEHNEIRKKLIDCNKKLYADGPKFKSGGFVPHNLEADGMIWEDPFAFLVAVTCDQGIKAEKAWEIPYKIKERLGFFDPARIAREVGYEKMESVFGEYPKLHRFYKKMAKAVLDNAKLVTENYNGDASQIWKNESDPRIIELKLREFSWINQKKSSMAVNILIRDFHLSVNSTMGIDVSFDRHVRRVFLRTGLVNKDLQREVIAKAKELSPEYPGELDYPAWRIGRDYCFPTNPNCNDCCLTTVCPKFTNLNISERN